MPVPSWLSAIGHVGSDIIGGIIGARLGGDWREKATEHATAELRRVLLPDREDVMKALLLLGDQAAAIVKVLREANQKGFVTVAGKRYAENWIVNMLLKVEARDRDWVYTILNDICERDRQEFFAHLEILYNNGFIQWVGMASEPIRKVVAAINRAAGEQLPELHGRIAAAQQKFAERLERRRSRVASSSDPFSLNDFETRFFGRRDRL